MIEYKKEKWFEFRRIHCKEGYIDYFLGDQADDPNKQNKSRISLNSSGEWFRFKGENTWLNKRDFERNAVITIVNNKEEFSSDELKTILEIN